MVVIMAFGCIFGLLLGGLISLRPDHIKLISDLRKALTAGSWAVVAHPVDTEQVKAVVAYFSSADARILRSF